MPWVRSQLEGRINPLEIESSAFSLNRIITGFRAKNKQVIFQSQGA